MNDFLYRSLAEDRFHTLSAAMIFLFLDYLQSPTLTSKILQMNDMII